MVFFENQKCESKIIGKQAIFLCIARFQIECLEVICYGLLKSNLRLVFIKKRCEIIWQIQKLFVSL